MRLYHDTLKNLNTELLHEKTPPYQYRLRLPLNMKNAAEEAGFEADVRQTNHEGVLVDWIQEALGQFDGIVINPAAYTHTSIAILDALKAVSLPCAEVHLTDISKRESFRQISYAGMACQAHFIGMGFEGYKKAMEWAAGQDSRRV